MADVIIAQQFRTKRTEERRAYAINFHDMLTTSGDGISTATYTATVFKGTDASPGNIISGSAVISGEVATQLIIGGVDGVTYLIECEIVTDGSPAQTLEGVGLLTVTDTVKAE